MLKKFPENRDEERKKKNVTVDSKGVVDFHFSRGLFAEDGEHQEKLVKSQIGRVVRRKDAANSLAKRVFLEEKNCVEVHSPPAPSYISNCSI